MVDLGLTALWDIVSVYIGPSHREREKRKEKIEERRNVQTTPSAPTASAIGPCPTIIQIVGRPGTGSLPRTIEASDYPVRAVENQRGLIWKLRKESGEETFLYVSRPRRPDLQHILIKLHEDILNGYWVTAYTRMFRKKKSNGLALKVRKREQLFLCLTGRPGLIHIP